MMKKIKCKILLILVFAFVLASATVAFADTTFKDSAGKEIVTIPDLPDAYKEKLGSNYAVFLYKWDSGPYNVRFVRGNCKLARDGCYEVPETSEDDYVYVFDYESATGGFNTPYEPTYKNLGVTTYRWSPSRYVPIYATQDILSYDGSVFFKPPKAPKLTAVLKMTNLGGALSEVISLMPLVLLAVTSYLALRKAYSFVLMQLRKS